MGRSGFQEFHRVSVDLVMEVFNCASTGRRFVEKMRFIPASLIAYAGVTERKRCDGANEE